MAANPKRRAFVLSPECPYPLQGGGALRTASLLNYLARDYEIDLAVFRDRPDQDPAGALPPGLVRQVQVIDLPFHSRGAWSRVWRNTSRLIRGVPPLIDRFRGHRHTLTLNGPYDLAIVEHFWCAEYYETISRASARVFLNLHNIESHLLESCAQPENPILAAAFRRFASRCRQLEQDWLPRFDAILATSELDLNRLPRKLPVIVYPNAIPQTPVPAAVEENVIAFSGNLEYQPNKTAVRYFARQVWPILAAKNPALKWRLIGMNPWAISREIANIPRVEVTGAVPDAIAELAKAKVVVAPLLSGSGTRLKIIEAWAAGRAVVSTPLGAEGLPALDGEHVFLAREPEQFAKLVQCLLDSAAKRGKMGMAGRELFERELSWDAVWRRLDASVFFRV